MCKEDFIDYMKLVYENNCEEERESDDALEEEEGQQMC